MEMLNQKQKFIAIIAIIVVIGVIAYYYINTTKTIYAKNEPENIIEETEEKVTEEKNELIKVHITGAIKSNGIVEVEEKARIADVIEAAGGITEDADLTDVNLAYIIEDGQKIYIPSVDDKKNNTESNNIISTGAGDGIIEGETSNTSPLVNINKASSAELMNLPGIGGSTAAKIIEYRKTHGKFKTIEDIKNVSGIGDAKFNTIKDFISV